MMVIEYLKNPEIEKQLNSAPEYRKAGLTSLRRPRESELGTDLITYVKDAKAEGGIREEVKNRIVEGVVIARNPGPISEQGLPERFNEWLIGEAGVVKNYGKDILDGLTEEFVEHRKKGTIHAIEITPEVLRTLGVTGETLEIKVSWTDSPMIAHIGDYLTDGGYSISKFDMEKTYEPMVKPNGSVRASDGPSFFGSDQSSQAKKLEPKDEGKHPSP
jgi:hypothetical protein